jgi:hypothetical protein
MAVDPEPVRRLFRRPSAARTRWIAVWLLLLSADLAVSALARRLLAGASSFTAEDLLRLLLVPPAQTAALAGLLAMRRAAARPRPGAPDEPAPLWSRALRRVFRPLSRLR